MLIENVHINHLKHLQFFADDTAVVSEGKSWQNGFKAGNYELAIVKSKFVQNRLTVNTSKTKRLLISLRGELPAGLHRCGVCASTTCDFQCIEKVDHYIFFSKGVIVADAMLLHVYRVFTAEKSNRC